HDHVPAACDYVSAHRPGNADVAPTGDEIPADAGGVRDRDGAAGEHGIRPRSRVEPHRPTRRSNAAATEPPMSTVPPAARSAPLTRPPSVTVPPAAVTSPATVPVTVTVPPAMYCSS